MGGEWGGSSWLRSQAQFAGAGWRRLSSLGVCTWFMSPTKMEVEVNQGVSSVEILALKSAR